MNQKIPTVLFAAFILGVVSLSGCANGPASALDRFGLRSSRFTTPDFGDAGTEALASYEQEVDEISAPIRDRLSRAKPWLGTRDNCATGS